MGIVKKMFGYTYKPFRGMPAILPDEVGALSLWTRDPKNILAEPALQEGIREYRRKGVLVELQISVTGFGGRFHFLELDVPTPEDVADTVKKIIEGELVDRTLIKIRIDPVYSVRLDLKTGGCVIVSNMSKELFAHIAGLFAPLGVRRFITSHRDIGNYDSKKERIAERFRLLGMPVIEDAKDEVIKFFQSVLPVFSGVDFGLCANPPYTSLPYQPCIANDYYTCKCPDLILSNKRNEDPNRPGCTCFKGVASISDKACYSYARGCVVCYSQREGLGKAGERFKKELEEFKADPAAYTTGFPQPYAEMCRTHEGC
ncbi:MAG: hypothetical protein ABIG11_08300 [bacterium]